jgi:circadian clock protein KaiC
MDVKALEEKGLFSFMDFMTMDETGMNEVVQMIMEEIGKTGAKRVVVDSISVILQSLGQAEARKFLHGFFGSVVKSMGVTTILLGEIPFGEVKTGFGVEEFVVDGVIFLRTVKSGIAVERVIAKNLYQRLGLQFTPNPVWTLVEYVNHAKSASESGQVHE